MVALEKRVARLQRRRTFHAILVRLGWVLVALLVLFVLAALLNISV